MQHRSVAAVLNGRSLDAVRANLFESEKYPLTLYPSPRCRGGEPGTHVEALATAAASRSKPKEDKHMENSKRKIEVFSAGCPLCNETLEFVRNAVSDCGCEVIERRCAGSELCDEAKQYGVRAMPTVVVDGRIKFEGRISREQAASLTQTAA